MLNYVENYLNEIEKGNIIAPETIKSVYRREVETINNINSDYVFDIEKGNKPIEFIEKYCKHSKGAFMGKPLELELFQKAKIQLAFGMLEKDTGLRRFREIGTLVARKNGKSTETSGVSQYMLMADKEGGPEILCAANKLDQAKIIFEECVNMREQSELLRELTKKRQSDIYFPANFGKIKAISSDTKTGDGFNAHMFSLDEFHEARSRALYDLLKQSQSARLQPLAWLISTNGFVREMFFDTQYEYYKNIALGTIKDDRTLPILYELDNPSEWLDEDSWEKSNPGLHKIKLYSSLYDNVERAKNDPTFKETVMAKDFNIPSTSNEAWLSFDDVVNEKIVDISYLENSYAIGGCDLSAVGDLTCATLLIRKPNDNNFYILQQYFIPQSKIDLLERTKSKETPYKLWQEQGYLTVCEGAQVNYTDVTNWFLLMVTKHNIRPLWIGYDRALAGYWVEEMKSFGFTMERVAQGSYTWSQPMKELEATLKEKRIIYQNNPILRWCLFNTGKKSKNTDGVETIQPVKLQSNRRIDGMVSLLNAFTVFNNKQAEYIPYVK